MEKFKITNISTEKSVLKSIRLKYSNIERLEKLSTKYNLSINRLINECIDYALNNLEEEDIKKINARF